MLKSLPKASYLASQIKVVTKVTPVSDVQEVKFAAPLLSITKERAPAFALGKPAPFLSGNTKVVSQLTGSVQFRTVHTDNKFPDHSGKRVFFNPKEHAMRVGGEDCKVDPLHASLVAGGILGSCAIIGGKSIILTVVKYIGANDAVLAMSTIEVDLSKIPEGKTMTFKWRGKPIFIKHRTDKEILHESKVDITSLRDAQHDSERTMDPKFLVVIGICTHLGCVPLANSGNYGGFFCPCHGSHYDGSGRIRHGPAPTNLEVPNHTITNNVVVIG